MLSVLRPRLLHNRRVHSSLQSLSCKTVAGLNKKRISSCGTTSFHATLNTLSTRSIFTKIRAAKSISSWIRYTSIEDKCIALISIAALTAANGAVMNSRCENQTLKCQEQNVCRETNVNSKNESKSDTKMTTKTGDAEVKGKEGISEEIKADEYKVVPLVNKFIDLMADEDLDESEVRHVCEDEYFSRRCLIASYNNEKKAFELGARGIRWRSEFKPRKISLDDFPTAASQHVYELTCHARNGWPVVVGKGKNWYPWNHSVDEYSKMMAFILETCEKSMDPDDPYARVYVIIDFQGISKFNADLRKVAAFARVIAKYPERVVGVGVNADLVTMAMWVFLSPLLDKRTRDRITIFGSNFKPFLEEHIGLDQIGPTLGGNRMEEYPPMSTQTAQKFKWNPTV